MTVDGVIDASGGRGGQPLATTSDPNLLTSLEATPGGSGAGGSILLQTLNLSPLGALAGRLNVRGGPVTNGIQSSTGGAGSMGLVRVEAGSTANGSVPSFDSVARSVSPVDTTNLPASSAWVSVEPNGWQRLLVMSIFNQPDPLTGVPLTFLPDALSGAQSCWLRPEGNFFRLTFQSDDPMTGDRGWDMKVVLAGVEVDYRAPGSFEDIFGSDVQDPNVLGLGAPFIVRFQGARAIKEIADVDLCTVPLTGPDSPIQPGSLTPWVLHPDELNTYWEDVFPASPGEVSKRKPNMIRYQIVFNRLPANFVGVDEVFIKMQPE
jgi:hypothetical protein